MPKQNLFKEKLQNILSGHNSKSVSILSRPVTLGFSGFIILAILFSVLIYQRYLIVKETQKKEAYDILSATKDELQEILSTSLSTTKILSFFIDNEGKVKNFYSGAAQILNTNKNIDALELVPNGVIQYIYPLKGNEEVIGFNILTDSARSKEAYKAIQKKELFYSGPYQLKQGGFGIVGRLPIFRNEKFWGFSAVVIKMSTLLKAVNIDSTGSSGYYFQLSKINPDTKKEEFFIHNEKSPSRNYLTSLYVPIGEWKLSVEPVSGNKSFADIFILALTGILFSILGGGFIFIVVGRPEKLDRLVKARTRALKNSESKYRTLIERVSDAFVSLDKDWNYTYLNEKAGEIFSRKPEKLVGENIWAEFPEGIDKPFYHIYHRAMETQQYQYLEEYYPHLDKWFENHIYPSKDGLTIFFNDVTEIKQVSLALKENEEKYRSLIEQASDGIVLSDLDGYILEVNKSLALMSGYCIEEMPGKHLYTFLPEEDVKLNPLRFKELMEGKSLLYERRLLKKDGTVLDIEVNSKMAGSQTMIGFIRDITERKKNEDIFRYQARLLESVSDAITSLDINRCIVTWNKACEELYGFTTEEVIGKKIPELVTFEFPGTTAEQVFKQVFIEGKWRGEFNFIHPKTNIKTHLLSSINLLKNTEGDISGFIITSNDITERKKAEEKLFEEEKNLQYVLSSTADNFYVINPDYIVVLINKIAERNLEIAWGRSVKPGTNILSVVPENGEEPIKENFEKAFAGERTEYEMHHSHPDLPAWVMISFTPVVNEAGTIIGVSVVAKDISERKKAEVLIQESEERYRALVENAPEALVVFDAERRKFVSVSESATKLFGMSKDALLKLGPVELSPEYQPDGRLSSEAAGEYVQRAIVGEKPVFEWIHCDAHGKLIPCEIWLVRLPSENTVLVRGSIIDITERKKAEEKISQSEQKYRLLFYNNPLPMWMATIPDLDIVDVNESAIKQYGYTRKEFLKLNAKDLRPAEDVENFIKEVNKMDPGITNKRPWRHKRKDGAIIQVEIYSHEILYEGKRVWLGLSHDVTEKYNAKELLEKSYEDIRQLASNLQSIRENERTNISREIHDELGQQLTGLKMDMHWLSRKIENVDDEVNNKMKESIELIDATIISVRKIATDLRPSILDDLGLLPALEWQSAEFEKRSGTKVKFINEAGDITVLPAVATALFRIYQELLTNVARHASADLVTTSFYIDDKRLYFSIADNGAGFNADTINKKKTLGLLGIKERTLLIGGTYEIKTKQGKGSETIISIPLNLARGKD